MDINPGTILFLLGSIAAIGILVIICILAVTYAFNAKKIDQASPVFKFRIGLGIILCVVLWMAT